MKKFCLLLFTVACLSCSKDDAASKKVNSINPPSWIQGSWKAEGAGGTSITGFRFTSSDMILLGLVDMSYKDNVNSIKESGGEANIEEDISSENYEISIDFSMGASIDYSFSKIDENTISWDSNPYGTIQLQKQ